MPKIAKNIDELINQSKKNKMNIFRVTFLTIFITLYCLPTAISQHKKFIVVLDAGHGGGDPGKVHGRLKEKDIALKITLKVGKILSKNKNIKVVYTRKTDKFIGLYERGQIANKAGADLFVSIHCNAHRSQARGAETWVLGTSANKKNLEVAKAENQVILMEDDYEMKYKGFDLNSPESIIGLTILQEDYLDQSIQLASIIQKKFKNIGRVNRGVKQNIFVVLHQTYMPSVLIETGFITNRGEGKFLKSSYGQNKMAKSISKGILTYMEQLNLNSVQASVKKVETRSDKKKGTPKNKIYKVQIASGRKISTKSYNFKGLRNIERKKYGSVYKYYYKSTTNYNIAKKNLLEARKKGYKSAFIVAFNNGKKVNL